jgi:hypothetical protein
MPSPHTSSGRHGSHINVASIPSHIVGRNVRYLVANPDPLPTVPLVTLRRAVSAAKAQHTSTNPWRAISATTVAVPYRTPAAEAMSTEVASPEVSASHVSTAMAGDAGDAASAVESAKIKPNFFIVVVPTLAAPIEAGAYRFSGDQSPKLKRNVVLRVWKIFVRPVAPRWLPVALNTFAARRHRKPAGKPGGA